jgi:transcription elongation GreA/GreB family factor
MQKDVILTPEGLENLKKEIEYLSTDKRREVAERIKEARSENRLSNESPVGKALLGHKRNDVVDVNLPNGKARKLKITKIEVA